MSPTQILAYKHQILQLFEERLATNLSEAAEYLGVPKLKAYRWRQEDKEFRALLDVAEEILADDILKQLADYELIKRDMPLVTSLIFRLKKIRPEYRDSYKYVITDSKAVEHLKKLHDLLAIQEKKSKKEGVCE